MALITITHHQHCSLLHITTVLLEGVNLSLQHVKRPLPVIHLDGKARLCIVGVIGHLIRRLPLRQW